MVDLPSCCVHYQGSSSLVMCDELSLHRRVWYVSFLSCWSRPDCRRSSKASTTSVSIAGIYPILRIIQAKNEGKPEASHGSISPQPSIQTQTATSTIGIRTQFAARDEGLYRRPTRTLLSMAWVRWIDARRCGDPASRSPRDSANRPGTPAGYRRRAAESPAAVVDPQPRTRARLGRCAQPCELGGPGCSRLHNGGCGSLGRLAGVGGARWWLAATRGV
jgi:hypothetical protein